MSARPPAIATARDDVVFVLPPGGVTPYFGEHLGTAFLRAVLAQAGLPSRQYLPPRNVGLAAFASFLGERRPAVVGFTAYESNLRACRALAGVVRAVLPEAVVLVGGPNATFTPDDTLARLDADVALRGAGEGRIVEVVGAVLGACDARARLGSLLAGISGLVVRTPAGPAHTPPGDLSSFPGGRFACLDDLPSPYQGGFVHSAEIGIVTARGCNQHCTYCSFAAISARRVHFHSVERVLDDLTALAAIARTSPGRHGQVAVNDDAFTLAPLRARQLCEGMITRRLGLQLVCETRVDRVDPDLLRLMRRAGFVGISFGVESAVPRVLRAIGKVQHPRSTDDPACERERAFLAQVRRTVADAREAGLQVSVSVIGGLPGETAADFRATLAFVESLGVEYAHNILAVLPGTPLHGSPHEHGIVAGRDLHTGGWRTRHTYDVRAVPAVRGASTSLARRADAQEITDALCGRARPERADTTVAWAAVLHDREPDPRLAAWLAEVVAVHGTVVVMSTLRTLDRADRDDWQAALERSRTAWGTLALLYRQRSTQRAQVFRSAAVDAGHELVLSSQARITRTALRSDGQGRCRVPVWLASMASAPPRRRRIDPLFGPASQVADPCRWWTHERRCASPAVLHVWPDDRVTACFGGPPLGRVGDPHDVLAARGREQSALDTVCPIGTAPDRDDVSTLELASMLGWALGSMPARHERGTSWQPRRGQARRSRRSARRR